MPENPKTRAFVDTDQKDSTKAVERVADAEDRRLPGSEDGERESGSPTWMEKNKQVQRRFAGFQRNLQRQFDQQKASLEADLQRMRRENEDLRKSVGTGRGSQGADEAAHERDMAALEAQHTKHLEAGDSAAASKVAREMARKEAEFINAKTAAMMGEQQRTEKRDQRQEEPSPAQQTRKPTSAGKKFVAAQDWWDDPEFAMERGAANALHAKMVEEDGSDPESEEHYQTIARELKKKFPKLEIGGMKAQARSDLDDDFVDEEEPPPPKREARRAPVPNFRDRGDASVQRRRGGAQLTDDDFATMRAVGMDPKNDKHLVQFAKSKIETAEAMGTRR